MKKNYVTSPKWAEVTYYHICPICGQVSIHRIYKRKIRTKQILSTQVWDTHHSQPAKQVHMYLKLNGWAKQFIQPDFIGGRLDDSEALPILRTRRPGWHHELTQHVDMHCWDTENKLGPKKTLCWTAQLVHRRPQAPKAKGSIPCGIYLCQGVTTTLTGGSPTTQSTTILSG